ncbi:uncharacterized protein LOC122757501 [Drosophila mojavensis]|uniref:uncharacterized protein LOC122757501 n=1 Tax=Drosophila mojavensis TaxID=7230 RepID=UPI001CD0FB24|nr:uncharacterized protein LOC122757501 [Drosophila mojavensis]
MENLRTLLGARGRLKATITRISGYAEHPPEGCTFYDIDTKLDTLVQVWKQFVNLGDELYKYEDVQGYVDPASDNNVYEERFERACALLKTLHAEYKPHKLEEANTTSNVHGEVDNSPIQGILQQIQQQSHIQIQQLQQQSQMQMQQMQQMQMETMEALMQRLLPRQVDNESPSGSQQGAGPSVKDWELPRIHITPFDGDYKEWHAFKGLFDSAVHSKTTLTNIQKYHHLKSCLKGEAAKLIQHLPLADANYEVAWNSLVDRYEKPRYLVNVLLHTFTGLPKVADQNPASLRSLTNEAGTVIRALDASGLTDRDCWLIYLLMAKVDDTTRREWYEKSQDIANPTITQLLKFLDARCDRLELSQSATTTSSKPRQDRGTRNAHALLATSERCAKCNKEHALMACTQFLDLSIQQRYAFAKSKHMCFNCLRLGHGVSACTSKSSCKHCKRRHHSLLHFDQRNTKDKDDPQQHQQDDSNEAPGASTVVALTNAVNTSKGGKGANMRSTLPTAQVYVRNSRGQDVVCRILLDCGSELSYVSERCIQTLGLARSHSRISISGISSIKAETTRGLCSLHIKSRVSDASLVVKAHVLGNITSTLMRETINAADLSMFSGHTLADAAFNTNASIDILLGNDHIWTVLTGDKLCNLQGNTIAIDSIFGWIITSVAGACTTTTTSLLATMDINTLLQRFWELEELPSFTSANKEDELLETHFVQTHSRNAEGRYIVELPFKQGNPEFADTYHGAKSRFLAVERRLMRDAVLRSKYVQFMREYIQLDHMKEVDAEEDATSKKVFYMPHHPVLGAKLRVVFDGSFQDQDGRSLNDALHIGPCIQRNLFNVCMRFRMHKFVFSADIVKMFRQILVASKHQDFQRILWREHPSAPLKHFKLCTVTYGTASAPFLAVRVLEQLAKDHEHEFPRAAKILLEDFYVDDVLTGAMTEEELINIQTELVALMSRAQLELGKWISNSTRLCTAQGDRGNMSTATSKVLGLHWDPGEDNLAYNIVLSETASCTKRQVLSDVAHIFDPLGILAPVVVQFKILLQELWLLDLDWDSELPMKQAHSWQIYRKDISSLQQLKIPRFIDSHMDHIELHAFSDASLKAYSAVVYSRVEYSDGSIGVYLVAAKTRVAPLKLATLPRLELCGTLLLTRLVKAIQASLGKKEVKVYAWCDSTIVLSWLSNQPCKLKMFVANRTAEILETIPRDAWRHWKGPSWLHDSQECLEMLRRSKFCCSIVPPAAEAEFKANILTVTEDMASSPFDALLTRVSSWLRLIRIIAYVRRFVHRVRSRNSLHSAALTFHEIDAARKFCLGQAQNAFVVDRQRLLKKQPLQHRSKLSKLAPFVDQDGLIRVGGRLENSYLSRDAKHPIVLPNHHRLVELLLKHEHQFNLHPGVSAMFAIIRQKYWILGSRNLIRRITHECLNCFKQRHHTTQQLMANLPATRVRQAFTFEHIGVDYAGPILLKVHKGRNPRKEKGYICLFVCMVTSALHLELATDLSTDTFLAALRRFMARRGKPAEMYSDNGRNFVGAKRTLNEMSQLHTSREHNEVVARKLAEQSIKWNFIPPYTPHWGGKWESAVRSVKLHLRRVIGNTVITFEQMRTLLTQIEAVVNSRPLCATSDTEIGFLSPAHFLIGRTYTAVPDGSYAEVPTNRLGYWQHTQAMLQGFWKRWQQEYLTALQQRPKWSTKMPNISLGDIVLIKDSHTLPAT